MLNDAWLRPSAGGIAAAVRRFFADDVVVVGPDLSRVARGGDAVAASYDAFVRSVKLLDVEVRDPVVDELGDVAVATVVWSMTYEVGGTRSHERGHDVYVLRKSPAAWRICWRQIVSVPSAG